jgi:hypothetical protein
MKILKDHLPIYSSLVGSGGSPIQAVSRTNVVVKQKWRIRVLETVAYYGNSLPLQNYYCFEKYG